MKQQIMTEILSLLKSFFCSICQSDFDQFYNKPMIICNSFHLVCKTCLKSLTRKRQLKINHIIYCPICKEIRSQNAIMSFPLLFSLRHMALSIRQRELQKNMRIQILNGQIQKLMRSNLQLESQINQKPFSKSQPSKTQITNVRQQIQRVNSKQCDTPVKQFQEQLFQQQKRLSYQVQSQQKRRNPLFNKKGYSSDGKQARLSQKQSRQGKSHSIDKKQAQRRYEGYQNAEYLAQSLYHQDMLIATMQRKLDYQGYSTYDPYLF